MHNETAITPEEALAAMLAGDLMTIPGLCATTERWHVDEEAFMSDFLLRGLPCRVLDFGGYKHILVSPTVFDQFMCVLTDDGEEG